MRSEMKRRETGGNRGAQSELPRQIGVSPEPSREFWNRAFMEVAPEVRDAPPGRDLSDIVSRLRSSSAVRVLDVGCGLGHWSVTLARTGFHVLAVDVSFEALRIVRERARREGLAIATAVCAAQELSQLEVHVDAVVCNSVLDHMRPFDAELAAGSMAHVLKPAGLAYVSFDGLDKSSAEPEVSSDYFIHSDGTWEYVAGSRRGMFWRFYDDAEVRRLFREFEEVEFIVAASGQRRAWFRKPRGVQGSTARGRDGHFPYFGAHYRRSARS
jgi:SAM-dependent methyltransferase